MLGSTRGKEFNIHLTSSLITSPKIESFLQIVLRREDIHIWVVLLKQPKIGSPVGT